MQISASPGAAFFDRDGVLIEDKNYAFDPSSIAIIPGAPQAIRLCRDAGYKIFIVTNQSGVARGIFTETQLWMFHRKLFERFANLGALIDDLRYCPHHPDAAVLEYRKACDCRKPEPGMILDLLSTHDLSASGSFLVGDKESDLQAAKRAGVRGYQFSGGTLDKKIAEILVDMRQRPA